MTGRRVAVIGGGPSAEHEVSLASAAGVVGALIAGGHDAVPLTIGRDGHWCDADGRPIGLPDVVHLLRTCDVVLPMVHGRGGEDGALAALAAFVGVPVVGTPLLGSAVGMDKATMKAVFQAHGLPIVKYTVVLRHEWREQPAAVVRRVKEVTGFPCFVKPSNLGSSVGISKVRKASELAAALDEAARHDRKIVVERAVKKPREVEVSVLGNDAPQASLPGEITYDAEWYDYATKYTEGEATVTVPAAARGIPSCLE